MTKKFKVLGQPDLYYTIPPSKILPPSWINVTYQDANGNDYWVASNGTNWDSSIWIRQGGGSQMRLRTYQPEGDVILFWIGLRPKKIRITTADVGDNGTSLYIWNKNNDQIINTSQDPLTTVEYDLSSILGDFDLDRLYYDTTISKIEILL